MKNQTKSIAENWKMNLIERLGLEKCKAIVSGAQVSDGLYDLLRDCSDQDMTIKAITTVIERVGE